MQPSSKQCVQLTPMKYPPPCQTLRRNFLMGQGRGLVRPCPKRVPQALTPLREAEELSYKTRAIFTACTFLSCTQQVLHSEGLRPSYSRSALFLQLPPEACAPGNLCSASVPQPAGWSEWPWCGCHPASGNPSANHVPIFKHLPRLCSSHTFHQDLGRL